MSIAIIGLLFISFVLLSLNALLAEVLWIQHWLLNLLGTSFLATHFILGVLSSLLALFSVIIMMFYFIGTAKAVKEGVRDSGLDRRYYEMTLKYKRKFFPIMTLSLLVYIALPCLGTAVTVNYVSPGFHGMFGYLTLATHAFICYQGVIYLLENDRLVSTVHRKIQEKEIGQ